MPSGRRNISPSVGVEYQTFSISPKRDKTLRASASEMGPPVTLDKYNDPVCAVVLGQPTCDKEDDEGPAHG